MFHFNTRGETDRFTENNLWKVLQKSGMKLPPRDSESRKGRKHPFHPSLHCLVLEFTLVHHS